MNFLRKLLGGASSTSDNALYIYVKPQFCDEVLRVRINMNNDLSLSDDGEGYFVRKIARGARCPFPSEVLLRFDRNRRLIERTIDRGEFMTEADYHPVDQPL